MSLEIDESTGLVSRYAALGVELLAPGAFAALVIRDDEDPWGMRVRRFRDLEGEFKPVSPPRLVEDGEVRSVVQADFGWGLSRLLLSYFIPKEGASFEVEAKLLWAEENRMLKLRVPTLMRDASFMGQSAFGRETLDSSGDEVVAQSWTAVVDEEGDCALSIINRGCYGSDFSLGRGEAFPPPLARVFRPSHRRASYRARG